MVKTLFQGDSITDGNRGRTPDPKLAAEWNAVFIPLQAEFESLLKLAPLQYWIWDGIHPTVAGHALITRLWLNAAKNFLKL